VRAKIDLFGLYHDGPLVQYARGGLAGLTTGDYNIALGYNVISLKVVVRLYNLEPSYKMKGSPSTSGIHCSPIGEVVTKESGQRENTEGALSALTNSLF